MENGDGIGEGTGGANGKAPDPRQDKRERRVVRKQYRDLMNELHNENKDQLLSRDTGTELLNSYLEKTDSIFAKVKMPREAALDSQVIAVLAQMGKQQAQALQTEFVTFQTVEYAEKLLTTVGVQRMSETGGTAAVTADMWEHLGKTVSSCFKRAPVINYLFGAFERGPPKQKVRVERRQREKDTVAKTAVVPKQVLDIKDQEKREATTEEVEHILAFLNIYYKRWNQQPICFFEFIIDPNSFGKTIENIFYTSFLVRDGHVRIFQDDDRLPVIEPIQQKEDGTTNNESAEKNQVVLSMTKSEWQDIVKTFNINTPLIPPKKHKP